MIAIMGDASLSFREEVENDFKANVSGYGYHVASKIASKGLFPALFCPLGGDRMGSLIVEQLVVDEVLFDSDLVRLPFKTNVEIEFLDGSRSDFFSSSASAFLDSEKLQLALSMHTNIKAVHLSTRTLGVNPTASSFIDQTLFISPRPFICVDLNEASESPVLKRSLSNLLPYTDLFLMKDESMNEDVLKNGRFVILKGKGSLELYKAGEVVSLFSDVPELDDSDFASSLLSYLETSSFLPPDGKDMENYDIDSSIIEAFLASL